MIAEIICVGSELLLGETINTNASFIAKKLSSIGIDCLYQTTVGDNPQRIKDVLKIALSRADLIVFTGGLGPTDDDITVENISEYFGEELVLDEESYKKIQQFFVDLNKPMPPTNDKQAYRPRSANVIPNPVGTAPGFLWEKDKKIIMTFPGVPDELYRMWDETAQPYLQKHSSGILLTRHLKYFGIPEAALANRVKDLMMGSNPTVAPLVGRGEPRLRIAAKASSCEKAKTILDKAQKEILSRTSECFYGIDDETLEIVVGKLLKDKELTVSTAESCTGGLVSSRLTDVSGSSDYIKLNIVTYSNEAKTKMLGVSQDTLTQYGAVSEETAKEMAEGIRKLSGCDIGLSLTGIAGPTGGSQGKPVGLVYIGISDKNEILAYKINVPPNLDREEIKYRFSQNALNILRLFLQKK